MAEFAASENVWLERTVYDEMEVAYQTHLQKLKNGGQSDFKPFQIKAEETKCTSEKAQNQGGLKISIAGEIAKAREHIRQTLDGLGNPESCAAVKSEGVTKCFEHITEKLAKFESILSDLTKRVEALEVAKSTKPSDVPVPKKDKVPEVVKEVKKEEEKEEEDDFELFGSDEEEDADAERVKQERLKAYEEKKSKKPQLVAKSNIILDVKPWDDETDMVELERCVRTIEMDGLLWGASKLVPLAYGIKKLQIACVVEDDKVSTEDLEEKILAFEDYVQSMDIAAFNKV